MVLINYLVWVARLAVLSDSSRTLKKALIKLSVQTDLILQRMHFTRNPSAPSSSKMLHLMLTARIQITRRPLLSVVLASRKSVRQLRRLLLRRLNRASWPSRPRRLSRQRPLLLARLLHLHHKLPLLLLSQMIPQR